MEQDGAHARDRAPLDLRDVFAQPWAGTAVVRLPRWLRWLPVSSSFRFRTEISDVELAESSGMTVHDTMTLPNGRTWRRTMRARLLAPGHWEIRARDMPGGAEQRVSADGFEFTPYLILAPVLGPFRIPLRCHDEVRLLDERTMSDTIEMRFLGVHVASVEMLLTSG